MSLKGKFHLNIALRLSLLFFSVFIFAIGLIYLYLVPQLQNQLTSQKLEDLRNYANLYSSSFLTAYNQGASDAYLGVLTQQYSERADARIMLLDASGTLVTDSLKGQAFDIADYPVVNQAINTRQVTDAVNTINDRQVGMAAVPLFRGNSIVRVVVVTSSLDDVETAVALVQRQLSIAAAGALALALAVIYLVSRFLAKRVRRIESGAKQIAEGDFAAKVPVVSQDELGQLAMTFNEMGMKLGRAFEQLDVEKRRAKLLLDDLDEGVIGVDGSGNIIFANPAAEALLEREIKPPQPLADRVPDEILSLWASMSKENRFREDTFMVTEEKALQIHTSMLSDQNELSSLMVLRDVSQEVKLDRSRRDFIANASHELRTPIFSLSGFLELLQDEEIDEHTKEEFIATMKEQVDRLSGLARNLLDLSQMDSGAVAIQPAPVPLKEVVEEVAGEFADPLAGASRILTDAVPDNLVARGDRNRSVQLMRILLDNALKYSPEDSPVEVAGNGNGSNVSLTVTDNGPGIAEEELPRVFERFYRGKGAGRVRGTGLGLPIARELVKLMDGEINVTSSDRGTAITVTLPKA
jgi:signal transduction histidine kinase